MMVEQKKLIEKIFSTLPEPTEVRQQIAQNLQERQALRQLLRLVEKRPTANNVENRRDG